jgi:hypothetical protein
VLPTKEGRSTWASVNLRQFAGLESASLLSYITA